MAEEDHKELKIVFIGDSGVGKTTTIQRYITAAFQKNLQPTVGTMFFSKTIDINDKEYRLQVRIRLILRRFGTLLGRKDSNQSPLCTSEMPTELSWHSM